MKTLIIGLLVLLGWSSLSTYVYVCKIKGLCNVHETIMVDRVSTADSIKSDSLPKVLVEKSEPLPENLIIYFAFDKSEFNADVITEKYLGESKDFLNQNNQGRVNITGFTDAVGSEEYNQALGYRRAQSVQQYFERKGVPAEKIIIESKGEKNPSGDNNTSEGRHSNRRAEITIKK